MKKTYLLLLLFAGILCFSCHYKKQPKTLDITKYNRKTISLEEIKQLRTDTTHHKAIMFIGSICYGCHYATKNYFIPAQKLADTTKWKFYYILRDTPKTLQEIEEIEAEYKRLGVDTADLYFFANEAQIEPSVEADNAMYHRVASYFKQAHKLGIIDGVPQSFVIDSSGNLITDETYFSHSDSVWYTPRRVTPSCITEPFEIRVVHEITRVQKGKGKNAIVTEY